jgi:hypothetical protein
MASPEKVLVENQSNNALVRAWREHNLAVVGELISERRQERMSREGNYFLAVARWLSFGAMPSALQTRIGPV